MQLERAMVGAGCFWGVQYYFDQIPGVIRTTVGYSGGQTKNPTYEQVCRQNTGHAEVVLIEFDPTLVDYKTVIKQFFRMHDPSQLNRQGPDVGKQYRSVIFYYDKNQKSIASKVKSEINLKFKGNIVTQVVPASEFYPAEEYHQKFTQKTGRGMCHVEYSPV